MKHLSTKLMLLILLLNFLPPPTSYSQTTVRIGNGTTELLGIPFYGYYDYSWSSMIYLKEEINAAGWNNAGQISKIAFQFYNSPSNYLTNNQKIYIAHTSATAVDGSQPNSANMQLVYDGSINWTIPTGLPNNSVRSSATDAGGAVWFGTAGGVAKNDGENWTIYNTSNSGLPNNSVYVIRVDASNNKWIGTFGGGVAKFDGTNWTVFNTSNSGIPADFIYSIEIDPSGNVWVATYNGIGKYDGSSWTIYNTSNSGLPNNTVYAFAFESGSITWIATYGGGLAKFDGSAWTLYTTAQGLASNNCYDIAIDGSGNKWIATYGAGLSKFDGTTWTTYNSGNALPANRCLTVTAESNGNIWVGFESNGVSRFDGSTWENFTTSNSSLPDNGISDITVQSGTIKWISTSNGAAKLSGTTWTVYQKPDYQEVTFNSVFDWNNTDNILIYYENRDGSWASGYPTFKSYQYYSVYRSQYKGQDGSFPTGSTTNLRYYRPNIKLTLNEIPYPQISYTPLSNTSIVTNRTFSNVTITDPDGVNTTSGTKPRIYYKRSSDNNTYIDNTNNTNGWKYTESSSSSSPYSFVINYDLLYQNDAPAVGTVIQYFIVAQDLASTPNVAIKSGSFNSAPSSVALTADAFPISGTISSYTIVNSFSGEIQVGTGQNYTSLTGDDAQGLFKAFNNGFITGNVTVKVTSALTETGAVALNQTSEENGSGFYITIQPNDASVKTISGNKNLAGLIRLNGADRVTFDGRHQGSGNYLTIINTETLGGSKAAIQLMSSSSAGGCNNVTIRNCNISLSSSSELYCIYAGGSAIEGLTSFTGGYNHDNLTISDNVLTKALVGVFAVSGSSYTNDNLSITGNVIGSSTEASRILRYGIIAGGINGGTISANTIFNLIHTTSANAAGIYIQSYSQNVEISKNKIYSVRSTSGAYGASGIDLSAGRSDANISIMNNVIFDIFGIGSSAGSDNAVYGIRIRSSQGNINVYYNSVNLYGEFSFSSSSIQNCALYVGSSCTALNIRNNVLANSMYNSHTSGTGCKSYTIFSASDNTAYTNINYNDYYFSGTQGILGYLASDKTSLEAWKTATAKDANSKAINPDFSASNNLKPFQGSGILGKGTPINGITSDYEGITRSETAPSIGAYESGAATSNVVGWCNLDRPSSVIITFGANTDIYARAFIDGVTSAPGAAENLEAWIGINSENSDPASWSNWIAASFTQQQGNNDEFKVTTGATLDMGAYYFASRFRYQNGPFRYGGYNSNGGNFWDGTSYVSGVLTVNTFTTIPYAENFDGITPPNLPTSWLAEDSNNDGEKWTTSNYFPKSAPYALRYPASWATVNDWVFTPGFNLSAGTTYEISFWYRLSDAGSHKLEVKYGQSKTSSEMLATPLFYNDNITATSYTKATAIFTPSASGLYYFGWHCFSASGSKPHLVVDNFTIRVAPAISNTQIIPASSTSAVSFGSTGVTIQFSTNSSGEMSVVADKVNSSPGGALPEGLTNLLQRYWTLSTENTVSGTYSISLNLEGVSGINNFATLHLLKRNDAMSAWVDIGVPTDITQAPVIKWAYPSLTGFSDFGLGGGNDNPLPVELSIFSANYKGREVILNWRTETEVNNDGFVIERASSLNGTGNGGTVSGDEWKAIHFVKGYGNSNSPKEYSFTDKTPPAGKVFYRLKQIDTDGRFTYSKEREVDVAAPREYKLSQNYPNPFNPSTIIEFQVPVQSRVRLELFNITGELVYTLTDREYEPGYYEIEVNAGKLRLASGVYMYWLQTKDYFAVKKLLIAK